MKNTKLLVQSLNKLNIQLTEDKINKFSKYYDLLNEWNSKMNLTSISKEEEVIIKHFLDSALIIKHFEFNQIESIIDIGTGAGFPGIPLKILYPNIKIVLLDSLNKRINFLTKVCEDLNINDIELIHGRAEELGQNEEYREKFDLCVSRAVANLSVLSEYCIPFVKVGGYFISYKSKDSNEEINNSKDAVKLLGGEVENLFDDIIPNSDINRKLVHIKKLKNTSDKYPRKVGIPTKRPLL